jgi:hypothetical protein
MRRRWEWETGAALVPSPCCYHCVELSSLSHRDYGVLWGCEGCPGSVGGTLRRRLFGDGPAAKLELSALYSIIVTSTLVPKLQGLA